MRYLVVFCLLLLTACADKDEPVSQAGFFRIYEDITGDFKVLSVDEVTDGYMVLASQDSAVAVLKVDSRGNKIWYHTYPGYYSPGQETFISAEGYLLVPCGKKTGTQRTGAILKIDQLGNRVGEILLPSCSYVAYLARDADGWIAMGYDLAVVSGRSLHLVKLDQAGGTVWDKSYAYYNGTGSTTLTGEELAALPVRLFQRKEGGYLLTTFRKVPPSSVSRDSSFNLIYLLTASDGQEFSRLEDQRFKDLDQDNNGMYWYIYRTLDGRLKIGNLEKDSYEQEIQHFDVNHRIFLRVKDQAYPIVWGTPAADGVYFYMHKQPALVGMLARNLSHVYVPGFTRQTQDKGYIIAGTIKMFDADIVPGKICILKTDENGLVRWE